MKQDLTKGSAFPVILRFTIPIIGGNLFQLFYTLADTVIVGRTLGADALAAVGSTGTVIYFILCFIQGFTGGLGVILGQRFGARDGKGMRRSIAVSLVLCVLSTVLITGIVCPLSHQILFWMNTPNQIRDMAYDYMLVVLLGTGATIYYNMISNILRAMGDSRTPLYFLLFSSILNIALDLLFILPLQMGVAGAAWATVISQLLAAALSNLVGYIRFEPLHIKGQDFLHMKPDIAAHLKLGLPMGLQMSIMCIGQLAMQSSVNALGASAIAGYTAATKVDQVSVLVNNAFGMSIANYTAHNYGAGLYDRIRKGVRASLIQTESTNLFLCCMILLLKSRVVPLFVDQPTAEIIRYAKDYLIIVAPFYLFLGLLSVYRSAIQSMGNGKAPFMACIVELVMRMFSSLILSGLWGYYAVCFATPLAWLGAVAVLLPVYYRSKCFRTPSLNR